MGYLYVNYPKCTTCKKAKNWLIENSVDFEERHIKEENPSEQELRSWHEISGLPLKKFFNTSGVLYKNMELSKKLADMSEDEMFALLATDGMLVKRPILIGTDVVLVGFKPEQWDKVR